MPETLNGYTLNGEFRVVGGGRCEWTFAKKNDIEYFIKRYLTPKYPVDGAPGSERTREMKRQACEIFENNQNRLIEAIQDKVGPGGNVIFTVEFFRVNTFYYKVTEKVDVTSLTIAEIARLELLKRVMILLTIAHSVSILHSENIVHGDLKPDNILIKHNPTNDLYIAKLIDFDDSYFSGEAPDTGANGQGIVGTMEYYAPELGMLVSGDENAKASNLQLPSDIFTLGIIFCEYLTGKKPIIDRNYPYTWQSVAAEVPPTINSPASTTDTSTTDTGITGLIRASGFARATAAPASSTSEGRLTTLVTNLLSKDPLARPTIKHINEELRSIRDQIKDGGTGGTTTLSVRPPHTLTPDSAASKVPSDPSKSALIINFPKTSDKGSDDTSGKIISTFRPKKD